MRPASAGPPALWLRFGSAFFKITAAAADLRWLVECLCPQFERARPATPPYHSVRLSVDAERYASLRDRAPSPEGAASAVCFVLDRGPVRHRLWRAGAEQTVVDDAEYRCLYLVERNGAAVEILYGRWNPWARVALMRVVRELALARALADGGLALHAAAVAVGERLTLMVGPKRSGKTSLLIHALRHPEAALCANDRVLALDLDRRPRVVGVPTVVRLRAGFERLFPHLRRPLSGGRRHPACWTRAELTGPHAPPPPRDDGEGDEALLLSPAQFADLVGRGLSAGGTPGAILFPRVTPAVDGFRLRRLEAATAARALRANLFSARTAPQTVSVLSDVPAARLPDEDETMRRCELIAASAPCFLCEIGEGAYLRPDATAQFVMVLARACNLFA